MIGLRIVLAAVFVAGLAGILMAWHWSVGFDPAERAWWEWLLATLKSGAGLPPEIERPLLAGGAATVVGMIVVLVLGGRAGTKTLAGGRRSGEIHGTARWCRRS